MSDIYSVCFVVLLQIVLPIYLIITFCIICIYTVFIYVLTKKSMIFRCIVNLLKFFIYDTIRQRANDVSIVNDSA